MPSNLRAPFPALLLLPLLTAGGLAAQDPFTLLGTQPFDTPLIGLGRSAGGDVDGDGNQDLVVPSSSGPDRLFLGVGNGAFRDASASRLPASASHHACALLADFDADGDLDLVLGSRSAQGPAGLQDLLLLNDGTGHFTDVTATRMPVDAQDAVECIAPDVDGDGDLDLVVLNGFGLFSARAQNLLYLNDGSGSFTDATATHLPGPNRTGDSVAAGDFDGDGDPDLVFTTVFAAPPVRYFDNDGTGRYSEQAARIPVGTASATGVRALDLQGDGDLDLVGRVDNRLTGLLNDGTGQFTQAPPQLVYRANVGVSVVLDLDNDGDLDVTVEGFDGTQVLRNDGPAGLRPGPALRDAGDLACDVDGDQDLDLVSTGAAAVFLNDGSGGLVDLSSEGPGGPVFGGRPERAAAGDFDGDGDLDVWLASSTSNEQQVLFQEAPGRFVEVPGSLPFNHAGARAVVTADFDGDGDLDAVTCDVGRTRDGRVWLNDGAGTFRTLNGALSRQFSEVVDLDTADVDADGDPDLVVTERQAGASLWLNDGQARFTESAGLPFGPNQDRAAVLCDVDADGDPDLAVCGLRSTAAKLYFNDGLGRFQDVTATRLPALNSGATDIAAFDLEGDGDQDLVTVGPRGGSTLLRNTGGGSFVSAGALPLSLTSTLDAFVHVFDHDLDGETDVVVTDASTVEVLENSGQGQFVSRQVQPLRGRATVVADLDGDQDVDMLLVNIGQPTRLFGNLRRQLRALWLFRIGYSAELVFDAVGRSRPSAQFAPVFAARPARVPVPGLGVIGIDLVGSVEGAQLGLPAGVSSRRYPLPVPNDPGLVGRELFVQAVVVEGAAFGLTNPVRIPLFD